MYIIFFFSVFGGSRKAQMPKAQSQNAFCVRKNYFPDEQLSGLGAGEIQVV